MKQTGKMARAVLLLLLAGCLLGLTACGSKEPVAGFYQVDYELPINYSERFTFTPWVKFSPEDGMFTFMYGKSPRPMQAPSGYYTIEGDTITASTTNFGIVFYFEIIDSKTVKFTGANMEMGTELEALFSGTAQIGDVFYWTEPLPED